MQILAGRDEEITQEERARRERVRQAAEGVVSFATDEAVTLAAFALSGRLFAADLLARDPGAEPAVRVLATPTPVLDPRPDPTGAHVAYVADGALRVVAANGGSDRALATPEAEDVTYGLAEFVAAEEMSRTRGFWWSPDGQQLLVARVDTSPVARWYISDPANPGRPAAEVAYPAAGTANADVSVVIAGLDGSLTPVRLGFRGHAVPDHRALVARRPAAAAGVLARPADDADPRGGRGRRHGAGLRGHRPGLGRRGGGHAGLDARRQAGPGASRATARTGC